MSQMASYRTYFRGREVQGFMRNHVFRREKYKVLYGTFFAWAAAKGFGLTIFIWVYLDEI